MKSDYFKNEYPLEELVPDLKEDEEHAIANCDGLIWDEIEIDPEDLTDDQKAVVNMGASIEAGKYFREGYEHAQAIINKKLKAINVLAIQYQVKIP